MRPATRPPGRRRLDLSRSGPWIAAVGLLAVLWLVVMVAFLFAPWWGVVTHLAVLGVFVGVFVKRARVAPASTVWIPLFALLAWTVINAAGVGLLGWRVE